MEFLGEDAQGAFGRHKVNVGDAVIGGEGTKRLGGIDTAAGAGDGEGDIAQGCFGI